MNTKTIKEILEYINKTGETNYYELALYAVNKIHWLDTMEQEAKEALETNREDIIIRNLKQNLLQQFDIIE